jgi:hypothetical protein
MLLFAKGQGKQTIDCLRQFVGPARLKIDFAALCTDPGFDARQFYLHSFLLEFLRNRFPLDLATAL